MEDNKNLNEVDEAVAEVDEPSTVTDDLKEAADKMIRKVRSDAMVLGYRVCCQTVLQMIAGWRQPNTSHREYERIFKRVEEFCGKALKQNEEAASESDEATVQN